MRRRSLEVADEALEKRDYQAFVKALEMQQKSEDEAEALKAELARKTRANQQKLDALTEQVGRLAYLSNWEIFFFCFCSLIIFFSGTVKT